METSAKLYSLTHKEAKTYLYVAIFVAGNIVLPQLCHLLPYGGPTLLPIYFFTLIAAYKYGLYAGILTAVLSPLVNHLLFGMPPASMLPILLSKSLLLAGCAAFVARQTRSTTLWALLCVVLSYQLLGTGVEWLLTQSWHIALQDFRIGIPGLLIQWLGGSALLKWLGNRR